MRRMRRGEGEGEGNGRKDILRRERAGRGREDGRQGGGWIERPWRAQPMLQSQRDNRTSETAKIHRLPSIEKQCQAGI